MGRLSNGGTRRLTWVSSWLVVAAWLAATGCGSGSGSTLKSQSEDEAGDPRGIASGGASASSSKASTAMGGATMTLATTQPEQKANVDFEAPQSSKNYVYAANASRDSVAVIDATTLAIHVVNTGDQPRFLRTIPGRDAALLVDVGANDLAYIETALGKSSVAYFRDLPSANVVQVAPDGLHAVAFFDVTRMQQGKFETLQDVSVMSFGDAVPVATRMTVGFKARQVTFAGGPSGAAAGYVVTDDGISVLDFAQIDLDKKSGIAKTIPIFSATEPKGADVSVTPDGKYAVGRIPETTTVRLVELSTGQIQSLDLAQLLPAVTKVNEGTGGGSATAVAGAAGVAAGNGGKAGSLGGGVAAGGSTSAGGAMGGGVTSGGTSNQATTAVTQPADITDLVVAPDGTFALAVSRNRGVMLRVPIPNGFINPASVSKLTISEVTIGSVVISPNGKWAVLFTTAVDSERHIVIADLLGGAAPRILDLYKTIRGVAFSSSGDQAYVLHGKADGSPTEEGLDTQTILDRSYGYTLVDLSKAFRKLIKTDAEPSLTVTTPGAPYAFLSFKGSSTLVQRLNMESLLVDSIVLGSVPISLGVVPAAKRAFVNQDYAEGRLTFIDWTSLEAQTVTGYELNSKIRE